MTDDSISTNLNALAAASRTPFEGTGPNNLIRQPRPSQTPIHHSTCDNFITNVLFPAWWAREQVLDYCTVVAQAPDLNDPEAAAREAYNRAGQAQVEGKNERLDPYSGRFFRKESRSEELAGLCGRERVVEDIVRERSWDVVRSRCGAALDEGFSGGGTERSWVGAFSEWKTMSRTGRGNELP
ncbi:hypothetical protein DV738_g5672, partial [Chaetothyriales sp. CBS 135597]